MPLNSPPKSSLLLSIRRGYLLQLVFVLVLALIRADTPDGLRAAAVRLMREAEAALRVRLEGGEADASDLVWRLADPDR